MSYWHLGTAIELPDAFATTERSRYGRRRRRQLIVSADCLYEDAEEVTGCILDWDTRRQDVHLGDVELSEQLAEYSRNRLVLGQASMSTKHLKKTVYSRSCVPNGRVDVELNAVGVHMQIETMSGDDVSKVSRVQNVGAYRSGPRTVPS